MNNKSFKVVPCNMVRKAISKTLRCAAGLLILISGLDAYAISDAPVTTIATESPCAAQTVVLPVTVVGFSNITAVSLRIDYDPTVATFTGATGNPLLTGMLVNSVTLSPTQAKIMISWSDATPRSLASRDTLVKLTMSYLGGYTSLVFNNIAQGGGECEYADANGNPMNDMPTASYFVNGAISSYAAAGVSIAPSANPVCSGTPVTFTATPINGGTSPAYQWKKNGMNVGTNSALFTYEPLDGDTITCILTSGNSCVTGNPATSNKVVMKVNPSAAVSVSIAPSANPACQNASVTFTATPVNGGLSPTFLWKKNGINVGTNNSTYTYIPATSDIISCVMTSSVACATNNPATSNQVTMYVLPYAQVRIGISRSANPVCSGTAVTFTASTTNGGSSPVYQWKKNGIAVGTNSSTYIYSPVNNDKIICVLTSNEICITGNPATSNQLTMTVNPSNPVSVSISPSGNNICAGTSVTFTATPTNGGTSPSYQWKKNGEIVVASSRTYTYSPANWDIITCVLTSNISCPSGNPATSNTVTMTVNPILPVSVSISASANPVLSGTLVTFTAVPVSGGSSPVYQWFRNDTATGTNSSTYAYTPLNGDIITCRLSSSESCTSGNPALSNSLTMTVTNIPETMNVSGLVSGTACYNATQTIYVAGGANTFLVQSGGNATMIAGMNINYLPGTAVESGGYLLGQIAPAGPYCNEITPSFSKHTIHEGVVSDPQQKHHFTIYPNPTYGRFFLKPTTINESETCRVDIYGALGNLVLSEAIQANLVHEFLLPGGASQLFSIRVIFEQRVETFIVIRN